MNYYLCYKKEKEKRIATNQFSLPPYLFVLCTEELSMMIQEKVQSGHFQNMLIFLNGDAISNVFLFAYNCLLFTQTRLAKEVLYVFFCHASGLKMNIQKSRFMVSTNVSRVKLAKFESIVHFNHNTHLEKYLGFSMVSGRIVILIFPSLWIR
jgi:hypothetical protein